MPWAVIVRSPVMVDVLDAELDRIVRVRDLRIKVRRRSWDEPWFDELCRAAFWRKQAAYHRWRSLRIPDILVLFGESQREAYACYNASTRYYAKCKGKLTSASSNRNWWSTLK